MPIAASSSAFKISVGGAVATGATPGAYHVEVKEASLGESKSKKRPQLVLNLFGKDDPNNPSKEGKSIIKMFQSLPTEDQDEDTRLKTRGILKRLCYEGFNVPWPAEATDAIDPRRHQGKTAWILIDKRKDDKGELRSNVVAVSQTREGLPQLSVSNGPTNGANGANGSTSRRRR